MNGLLAALSGTRIVETHLLSLSEPDAHRTARVALDRLSPDWLAVQHDGPRRRKRPYPATATFGSFAILSG